MFNSSIRKDGETVLLLFFICNLLFKLSKLNFIQVIYCLVTITVEHGLSKWHCLSLSKWLCLFINLVEQSFCFGTLTVVIFEMKD